MRRTRLRRLAILAGSALAAAIGVSLFAPAAPAAGSRSGSGSGSGSSATIGLNRGQVGRTARDFQASCANIPPQNIRAGTDGWVFVLPDEKATLVSLRLLFQHGGTAVTVDIPAGAYPNGFARQGADKAWVILPAGWRLTSGTAQISSGSAGDFFNVTHVCRAGAAAGPSPTCSRSPGTPPHGKAPAGSTGSSGNGQSSAGLAGGPAASGGSSGPPTGPTPSRLGTAAAGGGSTIRDTADSMPLTGAPIARLVGAGLALLGTGAGLLAVRSHRRRHRVSA